MLVRVPILFVVSVAIWAAALRAQDQPASSPAAAPIVTDRPSVTDSSIVVPAGSVQLENGFQETGTSSLRTLDGPETLVRVGLGARTEVRIYVPDEYYNQTLGGGASAGSGFGDFALGVKQQLGPTHGFDLSVVAFLSFPTGAQAISSHGYDPGLQMPWSRTLSPKWTLAGMLSLYLPTQSGRRNLTGEPTILIDRQLTAPWSAFVEYAGDFSQHGGPRDLLHVGTALTVNRRQQLDFHAGVGSLAGSTYHFVGFGYSFRIQAFRRE
jgi:hypothetical protein